MNATVEPDAASAIQRWLASRDEKAAAWLFHAHRPQVLRAARAWGAPAWMEEDVVQEVFLRVFRALPRFEPCMPFAHWLAVIARNTCAKLRRHWCHRHKLSAGFANGAEELLKDVSGNQEAPDDRLIHKEQMTRFEHALAQLSERDRHLLAGHSTAHTPAQRVALHRARKRLHKLFHQPGFPP